MMGNSLITLTTNNVMITIFYEQKYFYVITDSINNAANARNWDYIFTAHDLRIAEMKNKPAICSRIAITPHYDTRKLQRIPVLAHPLQHTIATVTVWYAYYYYYYDFTTTTTTTTKLLTSSY